jgi:hypothetical protein
LDEDWLECNQERIIFISLKGDYSYEKKYIGNSRNERIGFGCHGFIGWLPYEREIAYRLPNAGGQYLEG